MDNFVVEDYFLQCSSIAKFVDEIIIPAAFEHFNEFNYMRISNSSQSLNFIHGEFL